MFKNMSGIPLRVEAYIQGEVGTFLGLKARLVKLKESPLVDVKSEADELLKNQSELEPELKEALNIIETKIKKGEYSGTDVFTLGSFYYKMISQINAVSALEKKAGVGEDFFGKAVPTWAYYVGGGLLLLFLIRRI